MNDRTAETVPRALLRLGVPFALAGSLNLLSMLGDRMWVGHVGSEALAGLGAAHAAWMLLSTLALGMAAGALAGVARSVGANRPSEAGRYLAQGLLVALLVGVVGTLVAGPFAAGVFELLGIGGPVAAPAAVYLQITISGLLLQAPLVMVLFALQGAGEGRASLKVGAAFPLANLLLDPLLIHGLGLGLPGAAWATVVANAVALAVGLRVLSRVDRLPLSRAAFRPSPEHLKRIVSVGGPGSLEHLVRNLAGVGLIALLAPFGAFVLSAYTAGLAIVLLLIFPGLALGQAAAALVGQSLGAERPERAWRVAWTAVGIYGGLLALAALGIFLGAERLVAAFDADPVVVAAGAELLRTVAPALPFLALSLVLSKALGAARRADAALATSAAANLAVQLPLAWILATHLGARGVWLGMALAWSVHGVLQARAFARCLRPAPAPAPGRRTPRLARALALGLLGTGLLGLTSCQTVDFTEKRNLSDPVMQLDDGAGETHFYQKTYYSREGSAGGIGSSAGGGCGCY